MRKYVITLFGVLMLMFFDAKASDLAATVSLATTNATVNKSNESTETTERQSLMPDQFEVRQNYPNPFNASTTIEYDLPESAGVYAVVYDILGHVIQTLENGLQKAGKHKLEWDGITYKGDEAASGVYFYVLLADDNYSIGKMLLLK